MSYEELARAFAAVPLQVYGVYETELREGIYRGHIDRPTSKCALIIPLSGMAVFTFHGVRRLEVRPGQALLGGVNMSLELEVGAGGMRYFLVHYLPEACSPEEALPLTSVSMLEPGQEPCWREWMTRLQELDVSPGPIEQLEKKALFYQLVGSVLHAARARHHRDNGSMMEQAIQYIRSHYMEQIALEALAGRCGMKPKYFSYLFRKYAGISPIHYLIRYRMSRARELLLRGRYSVAEVAKSVGYADVYYFSRLFKKQMGCAPSKVEPLDIRNNPSDFRK